MMLGELKREKGYSGGQEQDWMGCRKTGTIVFALSYGRETMDAGREEISGKWLRRVEEAEEHYVKRWFVKEKEGVCSRTTDA